MKKAFQILKAIAFLLLTVGAIVGYLFFQVWQNDEAPKTSKARWKNDTIALGHTATLYLEVETPWHRELRTSIPTSFPEFLPPVQNFITHKHLFRRGSLNLNGYRTWKITTHFVPTRVQPSETHSIALQLVPTDRSSPLVAQVKLPKLKVFDPGNLPAIIKNPKNFQNETVPALKPATPEEKSTSRFWYLIGISILFFVMMIVIYLRSESSRLKQPFWEKALNDLAKLEAEKGLPPTIFFSRLTDLLKRYTSKRFGIRATAKTSTEFLATVTRLEKIPMAEASELPWLAQLADRIKFAEYEPKTDHSPRAITLVRRFIQETKPQPEPDDDHA